MIQRPVSVRVRALRPLPALAFGTSATADGCALPGPYSRFAAVRSRVMAIDCLPMSFRS